MTALPKRIRIGVHDYDVIRLPKKLVKTLKGDCDDDNLRIRVWERAPRTKKQETVVHEFTHALFDAAPIDWDDIDEERIVTMLAPKLLQLIRDNPELMEYLKS